MSARSELFTESTGYAARSLRAAFSPFTTQNHWSKPSAQPCGFQPQLISNPGSVNSHIT